MFTPKLVLVPESDGEFTLLGEIETPNSCYVVREISREEPRQHPLPENWHSFVLSLGMEKGPCNPVKSTLRVRLPDLQIHNGETVVLFVMNGKEVLGWDRLTLAETGDPAQEPVFRATATDLLRPDLTDTFRRRITVDNTPIPANEDGTPGQRLAELGVIDSSQTRLHKRDMQAALKGHGWSITQGQLVSGPSKTVKNTMESIQKNAS